MKPWIAVQKWVARERKGHKPRFISYLRLILCFLVGLCVLLQGVSTNILGIPKNRWYPSYDSFKTEFPPLPVGDLVLKTPMMTINIISWDDLWHAAAGMIWEEFLETGQIVAAISASETFLGLGNL